MTSKPATAAYNLAIAYSGFMAAVRDSDWSGIVAFGGMLIRDNEAAGGAFNADSVALWRDAIAGARSKCAEIKLADALRVC